MLRYKDWRNKQSEKLELRFDQAVYMIAVAIDVKKVTKDKYSPEGQSGFVTAMKLKSVTFTNARIYCQDFVQNGRRIIIQSLLHPAKKQQGNSHREIALISKVESYEYKI